MYDELRDKAEKKVEGKKGFYVTAVVFGFISLILIVISISVPAGGFWIRFPILIFNPVTLGTEDVGQSSFAVARDHRQTGQLHTGFQGDRGGPHGLRLSRARLR